MLKVEVRQCHRFIIRKEFLTKFDQTSFYNSLLIMSIVDSTCLEENYDLVVGSFRLRRMTYS
jgi:hypothetical protein